MMQSCASRRSSEAAGPFFIAARKPWRSVGHRHLGSSSAAPLVWTANVVFMLFCCSSFRLPIAHAAGRKMTPSGTSPVVTRRHTYSDYGEKN